jgi:hypothetical protein
MPFRIALQDCLSGVLFGIDALPDCVSSLPFRIALQDCLSGLPFRVGLQDCRLGLPFRIACQENLFNFVLEGLKRVPSRNVQKEKQNDDIFANKPGIFFLEQTLVGWWSANRAARDDGSVANDVFRISVGGGWSLEEELEDWFSKENR